MPYVVIENFNGGMDTRRMAVAGTPGTLLELTNAHITRGGEIEKRKAFDARYTLPAGTIGMAAGKDGIVVFGDGVDPGVPSGVTYQRLQHPTGQSLTRVLSWDLYAGKLFVAAEFANGDVYHFYDGDRVTSWFDGRARGLFTVKETAVEAGALSRLSFFLYKDNEELRTRLYATNPDDPENPIDLTGGWVNTASGDGPATWSSQLESAVNAETGTTGVDADTQLVGGFAVILEQTDSTTNWNENQMWAEVEVLNEFTLNVQAQSNVLTCTSTSSCQNVFRLDSGVSGGATPYTYQWTIVDDAGATAELDNDTAAEPEMTVVGPVGDATCIQYPITVKCEVTDSTSTTISQTRVFTSAHCATNTTPSPGPIGDSGSGIVYREP